MINLELKTLHSLGEDDGTHLFGSPMFNKKLAKKDFYKEELFIGQINMSDLKPFDTDNCFPSFGMIYIIYDTYLRKYSVCYSKKIADTFLEGFNKKFDNFRYDHPLGVKFSIPRDRDEEEEDCVKMFSPVPDAVKAQLPDFQDYICLFNFSPKIMDDLGRNYLVLVEKCSCVLIKKKHLKKFKISKTITINV